MRLLPWILLPLLSGCVFDPDPGPDSSNTSEGGSDWADKDQDAAVAPAEGADNVTTDIYVSAPAPDGKVTVVGIVPLGSMAWGTGQVVISLGEGEENLVVDVGDDGSFALRLDAEALDSVQLAPTQDAFGALDQNRIDIPINRTGALSAGDQILGDRGSLTAEGAGQVRIIGRGALLQAGARVIGGNLTASSGAQADVTCSPDCQFEMSILGESGDEIALFLYFPYGMQAEPGVVSLPGSSDTQTVTVP